MGLLIILFVIISFVVSLLQIRKRQLTPLKKVLTIIIVSLLGIYAVLLCVIIFIHGGISGLGSIEIVAGIIPAILSLILIFTSPEK